MKTFEGELFYKSSTPQSGGQDPAKTLSWPSELNILIKIIFSRFSLFLKAPDCGKVLFATGCHLDSVPGWAGPKRAPTIVHLTGPPPVFTVQIHTQTCMIQYEWQDLCSQNTFKKTICLRV